MKSWDLDKAYQQFLKRADIYSEFAPDLSESDTRAKYIDGLLVDVMGWDEVDIQREEHIDGGFIDYTLSLMQPCMVVEAKKASLIFNLPASTTKRTFKIGGVLSNCSELMAAMQQARTYANERGITYCLVTNGIQYIFFRANNQLGVKWTDQVAVIFRDFDDIKKNFDLFSQALAKECVRAGKAVDAIPVANDASEDRVKYELMEVTHLKRPRSKDRNSLYPYFGEIVQKIFQDLGSESSESEILEHCYVDSPRKSDKSAPYVDREVKALDVDKKSAGDFQRRVVSALKAGKTDSSDVILLIGSVGVGKSTFIQRFRKVLAKEEINERGIWIYINFKKFSDTGSPLDGFVYGQIEEILDSEYAQFEIGGWDFLKQAFHADYEKLKRGVYKPIYDSSPADFDMKFSEWVANKSSEKAAYIEKILVTLSKRSGRSIFLAFDNADQLKPATQNNIFLLAQKIVESVKCYALIALREESYWKNRDSGPLNAFHNTAYHVQPPNLIQVLSKRFSYAKNLIEKTDFAESIDGGVGKAELLKVFDVLVRTILGSDGRYVEYLECISVRDTRRALDDIAAFMISGHTNIDAVLRNIRANREFIPIPFHEFMTSLILRDYEVYSEAVSEVINLFAVDGSGDASNFNRIAVLGRILKAQTSKTEVGLGYVTIEEVVADCQGVGILPETVLSIIGFLNEKRLIETETQIKDVLAISKYVRVTVSGKYYIDKLSSQFAYLDLIVVQTPIVSGKWSQKFLKLTTELNALQGDSGAIRLRRVEKRLERCEAFIEYLYAQFNLSAIPRRRDIIDTNCANLLQRIKYDFQLEKREVMERARALFT